MRITSKAERAERLKAAESLLAKGRDMTEADLAAAEQISEEIQRYDAGVKGRDMLDQLGKSATVDGQPSDNGEQFLDFTTAGVKALASRVAKNMAPGGAKALAPSGTTLEPLGLTNTTPFTLGKLPNSLLDVLRVEQHNSPGYGYLRQVTRTNNAAPVAEGATKPTSVYGVTRIEDKLEVVAHLSEPVQQYWLSDNTSLQTFIQTELIYGLRSAVENQILNGSGVDPQLSGILATSGIQVQAAIMDSVEPTQVNMIETLRSAIKQAEVAGYNADLIVLSANDWFWIEGLKDADGRYLLDYGLGGDRANRKLLGAQVVTVPGLAAGTGLVLDRTVLNVDTDHDGIQIAWAAVGTDFETNNIRARVEGRFNVSVTAPMGVVKVTLA